jgi:hypothetical protein
MDNEEGAERCDEREEAARDCDKLWAEYDEDPDRFLRSWKSEGGGSLNCIMQLSLMMKGW